MTAVVALGVAVLALVLSGAGILALIVWRENRNRVNGLAERLLVDARMEQLTSQTLAAMRDAARGRGGWS